MRNSNITFNIAGAFSHSDVIFEHYSKNKSIYNSYKKIYVYDGIDDCSWNGGRVNDKSLVLNDDLMDTAERYYSIGWGIKITLSNNIIDLKDSKGLRILEKFHKRGNGVILRNKDLKNLISKEFPLYETTHSITGALQDATLSEENLNFYRDLQKEYDFIIPRLENNLDPNLEKLDKSKIEILINDKCVYNCPYFKKHYDYIASLNLPSEHSEEELAKSGMCWINEKFLKIVTELDIKRHGFRYGMKLSKEQIVYLIDRGFYNFKILGRNFADTPLCLSLDKYIIDYDC